MSEDNKGFILINDEKSEGKEDEIQENSISDNTQAYTENISSDANKNSNGMNSSTSHNYQNSNDNIKKKPKNKKGGKIAAIIAGALIVSLVSGAAGAGIAYTMLSKKMGSGVKYVTPTPAEYKKEDGSLTIPDAVQKVAPAVVSVSTKMPSGNPFTQQQVEGVGSGFIFNEDGYILTNHHVIADATELKVTFNNGKEVSASVVNSDANLDLAVIKLNEKVDIPGVVELGDSDALRTGDEVVAIGNPLGTEFIGTATRGIVSSSDREISISKGITSKYIQTDAAINPGNSGGPLINTKGEVIGINTAKIGESGVEGIGFAIPMNIVKERIEGLSKPVLKLGISILDVTKEIAKETGMKEGVLVKQVNVNSVADKAGIRPGDYVSSFGGEKVKTADELNKTKEKYNSGDKVEIVIERNGEQIKTMAEF